MKRAALITGLIGLTVFSLLLAYTGLADIGTAVASVGWWILAAIVVRAVTVVLAGLGWQVLFPSGSRATAPLCVGIRFLRESVNQLLPVGHVGGDLLGARLMTFWRIEGALAGATTIADIALQAATQFLFALLGLAILVSLEGDSEIVRYTAGGLAFAAIMLGAFFVVQAKVGGRWIGALLRRLAGGREWAGIGLAERIFAHLGEIYASPLRVVRSAVVHMAGWLVGSAEVYVILNVMGFPVSVGEAVVIESLGQAVRGAAFAIPGGIGVQEGGYVALCGLFGIAAGPAIALSLVKRVADLAIGLPGLAAWQVIEGRRALRAGSQVTAPSSPPPRSSFAES